MNQDAWPFIAQMIAYFAVAHGVSLGFGKMLSSSPRPSVQLAAKRVEASAYFALAYSSLAIVNTWNVESAVVTDRGLLVMEWAPTIVKAAIVYFIAFLIALILQSYLPFMIKTIAFTIENEDTKWFLRLTAVVVVLQVIFVAVLLGTGGIADYLSIGWWVGTAICSILLSMTILVRAFLSIDESHIHTTSAEDTGGVQETSEPKDETSSDLSQPTNRHNQETEPELRRKI